MKILDGKLVSEVMINQVKEELYKLDRKLGLVVIQVGNDAASSVYVRQKKKMADKLDFCEEKERIINSLELSDEEKEKELEVYKNIGCNFEHIVLPEDVSEEELINKIEELNGDDNVDGILVQLPISKHLDVDKVINSIDPNKDVDGLNDYNIEKLNYNEEGLFPCTPLGVIEILKYYGIEISGKNVVVVGRSKLVGTPVSKLLAYEGANVMICHSKTVNPSLYTSCADILVVAVGKKDLITSDMVKDEAVVVDVGINRVDGKLYGDVDYLNVSKKCSYITPVPGGVGPMTVAMLSKNLLHAYNLRNSKKKVRCLKKNK